jgi:MFS family permease
MREDGHSPTHVRFQVLAFVSSLSILTYLDRTCIMRVQDDMKGDLGFSDLQMGFVFGAFTIGYGLFEVPGGWMGDVWGTRRVLTRIVVWWSVFTALTGSIGWLSGARDYGVSLIWWEMPLLLLLMLAVRFLFGCGEAGAYPNLARVVATWFPFRERGLAQGAIFMFARLGGAVAPVLIGQLSGVVGWQQAFWVFGVVGLAWCIAFYSWFRNTPEEMPRCNAAERALIRGDLDMSPAHAAATWPPWGRLLVSPTMWALCVASIFVNLAWYFFPTWQPRFFKDVYGISFTDSEVLTGLPYLCGALGAFCGGRLSDRLIRATGRRWGRSIVGLAGFGGAGLCALSIPYVAEAWLAVVLLCLTFLINDLAVPVIWAASTDISGPFAGTVSATMNTAGCIGAFLGPVITGGLLGQGAGAISTHATWQRIFALLASAWLVAGLAWLFVDASKPLVPSSSIHDLRLD